MERTFNDIAMHQVENHLVVEQDKCLKAEQKAINEKKISSEVEMWRDMSTIYGILLGELNSLNVSSSNDLETLEKRVIVALNNLTNELDETIDIKLIADNCQEILTIVRKLKQELELLRKE